MIIKFVLFSIQRLNDIEVFKYNESRIIKYKEVLK